MIKLQFYWNYWELKKKASFKILPLYIYIYDSHNIQKLYQIPFYVARHQIVVDWPLWT